MDSLDYLLLHDAWATNQLLRSVDTLSDEQLDRAFEIGHRTLRQTLSHIVHNVDVWSLLMRGLYEDANSSADPSENMPIESLIERHATASRRLAIVVKEVASRDAWDEVWIDTIDGEEKSYGLAIAHLITHSAHHRAQALNMMRHTGMALLPESDVFSWEAQYVQPSFVPDDFAVPHKLETDSFRLRMLSEYDYQKDYEAVIESRERLRAWSPNSWPRSDFSLAENRRDLVHHEYEFHKRIAFAYTVVTLDESIVIGCVYVNPSETHDAIIEFWLRDTYIEQTAALEAALRVWVDDSWPFKRVNFDQP